MVPPGLYGTRVLELTQFGTWQHWSLGSVTIWQPAFSGGKVGHLNKQYTGILKHLLWSKAAYDFLSFDKFISLQTNIIWSVLWNHPFWEIHGFRGWPNKTNKFWRKLKHQFSHRYSILFYLSLHVTCPDMPFSQVQILSQPSSKVLPSW